MKIRRYLQYSSLYLEDSVYSFPFVSALRFLCIPFMFPLYFLCFSFVFPLSSLCLPLVFPLYFLCIPLCFLRLPFVFLLYFLCNFFMFPLISLSKIDEMISSNKTFPLRFLNFGLQIVQDFVPRALHQIKTPGVFIKN